MKEYLKSLRWADYFYYAYTEPRKLAALASKEGYEPFIAGMVFLVFISFTEILSLSLTGRQTSFFYTKISYGLIMTFFFLLLAVLSGACIIDCACQFAGYAGGVKKMIHLISFSMLPRLLLLPLVFIFRVFNFAPSFFYVFFSMALSIWSVMIAVQGVSEIHTTGLSRTVMIVFAPFVVIGAICFLLFILMIFNIMGYFSVM